VGKVRQEQKAGRRTWKKRGGKRKEGIGREGAGKYKLGKGRQVMGGVRRQKGRQERTGKKG
jgi:hypothetical protein